MFSAIIYEDSIREINRMYGIDLLVTSVSSVTKLPPGSLIYLISVGPFILYAACYVSYFFGRLFKMQFLRTLANLFMISLVLMNSGHSI